jgi:eukaryotic-like serine/threonine-protein kinase
MTNKGLAAHTTFSHYRIVRKLGAGGMGDVYLAQDTSELGRTVALKLLPAEVAKDKDRLQRFTQEARTVSNLNHPNILTVHEFGQADSTSFMATEYVDGVTLREHLSRRRLKLVDVLDVATQIVAALNAAHEAGVTHRDLKPENVMIRRDQIVKVLDFGLAKPTAKATPQQIDTEAGTKVLVHTEPGLVMGTVGYMSPEQSSGAVVDQRTDLWSVGVVLYEMLAGCLPFQGKDVHGQIIAIQEQGPAPLSQKVEGVPERLEEIVAKCLAKERDERYQTARDLLIDLRNLRRRLDVEAEIERTVPPPFRATSGGASGAGTPGARTDVGATTASQAHPTSSAEYVITGIKQHKLATGLVVLTLVAGVIGFGLYLRAGTNVTAIESIAVMPFVNESGNADVEYLSDGMTETLISSLSQLPHVNVKARSSVFRYKGKEADAKTIGKDLSVQAVLNGRVAQRGDQLTLTLELVDVQNENVIWSEQYNRKQADLVSLQSEIARDVSGKLRLKLSDADAQKVAKTSTQNPEAYKLYLQGVFYWNQLNSAKAIEYFQQAITVDPNYAVAYSGLGDAYLLRVVTSGAQQTAPGVEEALSKARQFAGKALELDGDLPEAHALMGLVLLQQDHDFAGCEREINRALELNPNYAEGHRRNGIRLFYLGQFEAALSEYKKALDLDPLSNLTNFNYAQTLIFEGKYDEAEARIRKNQEMNPGFALFHAQLSILYRLRGNYAGAVEESAKTSELQNHPELARLKRESFTKGSWVGFLRALAAQLEQDKSNPYSLAVAYVELGDKDKAFAALEEVYNLHSNFVGYFKIDPQLNPLRDDARFEALLKKSGFPE